MSATTTARKRGGRVAGSEGYNAADVSALLGCVEAILPIGNQEWEAVLKRYRDTYATPNQRALRDVTSIKNKFRTMTPTQKPTGDPTRPTAVARAFAIEAAIKEKVAFASLSDDPDQEEEAGQRDDTVCSRLGMESDSDLNEGNVSRGEDVGEESDDELLLEPNVEIDDDDDDEEVQPQQPANQSAAGGARTPATAQVAPRQNKDRTGAARSGSNGARRKAKTKTSSKPDPPTEDVSHTSMAASIQNHLVEQGRRFAESSAERFMRSQLDAANLSLQHERAERKALGKRVERLEQQLVDERRTLSIKVERLEQKVDTLKDEKDRLRDRLYESETENRRVRARASPTAARGGSRYYPTSVSPYSTRSSTRNMSPLRPYGGRVSPHRRHNDWGMQANRHGQQDASPSPSTRYGYRDTSPPRSIRHGRDRFGYADRETSFAHRQGEDRDGEQRIHDEEEEMKSSGL